MSGVTEALLREADLPVTGLASGTGRESLGTFGWTLRHITGESPGELRARGLAADAGFRDPSGNGWKMIELRRGGG